MENTINYDEYDAHIHGYDYHTGAPVNQDVKEQETCWTNPLNSIYFILSMKEDKE